MTLPEAGTTHDLVVYVNHSLRMGFIAGPRSYRIRNAPTFLPQFTVGDPTGINRTRWKSWIQYRFDGGAGQIFYSGTRANNRYAESNLMDLGLPIEVVGGLAGRIGARGLEVLAAPEPEGLIAGAIRPRATTSQTPLATLFTKQFPVYCFEMSSRVHVLNWKAHVHFIGAESVFNRSALETWQDPLTQAGAMWAVLNTQFPQNVMSAVQFSNILAVAQEASGIRVYDGAWITPAYSTNADRLEVYDSRLWRTVDSKAAVLTLQAGNTSIPAFIWSDYKPVGDQSVDILNTCVFAGRLYFGKGDSLFAFDAGRIFPVIESFNQVRDTANFSLMCEHKGSMYFNIRQRLYRYSSAGELERLQTPDFDGIIVDGKSNGDELLIVVRTVTGEGELWIFDSETGGTRRWFTTREYTFASDPTAPPGIAGVGTAFGYTWMLPVQSSAEYAAGSPALSYIAAANRVSPPRSAYIPYFAKSHAYFILSMQDYGYPDLLKLFNALKMDYGLFSNGDRIDAYYLTRLEGPHLTGALLKDAAAAWTDGTSELSDGSVLAAEGAMQATSTSFDTYFFFDKPVEAVRFIFGASHVGITGGTWYYWNGVDWQDISGSGSFNLITEAGDQLVTEAGDPLVGTTEGLRLNDGTINLTQTGFLYPGSLTDWAQTTIQGRTGYPLRYVSPSGGSVVFQMTEVVAIDSLQKQAWRLLGTVGDPTSVRAELPFPDGTISRELMLKFDCWGTDASRPEIRRLELEFIEEQGNLRIVDVTALAYNGVQLLNMQEENSGAYIGATLLSLSRAPGLYVWQLPWPTVRETMRARVNLVAPGVGVPVLAYGNSWAGAPIPIRLDEM